MKTLSQSLHLCSHVIYWLQGGTRCIVISSWRPPMGSIEFHTSLPHYRAADPTLAHTASVDGMPVYHVVAAEALEEHFGAHS